MTKSAQGYFQILSLVRKDKVFSLLFYNTLEAKEQVALKTSEEYHELTMSDRTYICPKCGHFMGRDYQAALNIDKMGFQMFLEFISAA